MKPLTSEQKALKTYELLTQARVRIMEAQPFVETWMHRGTEKSASGLLKDTLVVLDLAIERAKVR